MDKKGEVNGALMACFARACVNHKILFEADISPLLEVEDDKILVSWFNLKQYKDLCDLIAKKFVEPDPVLNRVGEEMMNIWYNAGPGKSLVRNAVEFLQFQTGSEGYHSMVRGDKELLGAFDLKYFDPKQGVALVYSSTPLHRQVELGVLRGGLRLFKDSYFVKVTQSTDKDVFFIEFK